MRAAVVRTPDALRRIAVHELSVPSQLEPGLIRLALHATSLYYYGGASAILGRRNVWSPSGKWTWP